MILTRNDWREERAVLLAAASGPQNPGLHPLSPGAKDNKFYVPGIGFVLEVDPETGETLELVDCSLC